MRSYVGRLNETAQLEGGTLFTSAQVDSWIEFATLELVAAEVRPRAPRAPRDPPPRERPRADARDQGPELQRLLTEALTKLDGVLGDRTYLVGETISLGDIAVACAVRDFTIDAAATPNLQRWLTTCINQPQFR